MRFLGGFKISPKDAGVDAVPFQSIVVVARDS